MRKPIDVVKKQIEKQTRPDVGNIKIESNAVIFKNKPQIPGGIIKPIIPIYWDRAHFIKNRGDYFDLSPETFNGAYRVRRATLTNTDGNFTDNIVEQYSNIRYSTIVGNSPAERVTFRLVVANASVTIYVNSVLILSSNALPFQSSDISFVASRDTLLQIYIYSTEEDFQIRVEDELGGQVDYSKKTDNIPFLGDLIWDVTTPIEAGIDGTGINQYPYIDLNITIDVDDPSEIGDLGGFGLYTIDFIQDTTIAEVNDGEDWVRLSGEYLNYNNYFMVDDVLFKISKILYQPSDSSTYIYTTDSLSGVSASDTIYRDVITHKKDDVFNYNNSLDWTIRDIDIENGTAYYYLVDTYDNSPNKNRGNLTTTYQTIVAGTISPPTKPTIVDTDRISYKTARITIDIVTDDNVASYHTWYKTESFGTKSFQSGSSNITGELNNVTGLLVGNVCELDNGSTSCTEIIVDITGSDVTFNTALPFTLTTGVTLTRLDSIKESSYFETFGDDYAHAIFLFNNMEIGEIYTFWVSCYDTMDNENLHQLDDSGQLSFVSATTPTLSNITHIFSSRSSLSGLPGGERVVEHITYGDKIVE